MSRAVILIFLIIVILTWIDKTTDKLYSIDLGITAVILMLGWILDEIKQCRKHLGYLAYTLNLKTREEETDDPDSQS